MTRECGPNEVSNHWKNAPRTFPIIGNFRRAAVLLALLAVPAASHFECRAQFVDTALASDWLASQIPLLTYDPTSRPVRVLALTALALHDHPDAFAVAEIVRDRQDEHGWWARPGAVGALADQAAGLLIAAEFSPRENLIAGLHRLLDAQQKNGGWSEKMNSGDPADAVSTALAAYSIFFAADVAKFTGDETKRLPRLNASRLKAAAFLETLQDAGTGALGHESRAAGDWASTAAGITGMGTSGPGRSLPLRRAIVALARDDVLGRRVRHPMNGALLACQSFGILPPETQSNLVASLASEFARNQQADGRWPAPAHDRADGDECATAIVLLCHRLLEIKTWHMPPPPSLAITNASLAGARLLLSLPAEEADTLLINPADFRGDRLIVTCDWLAVDDAFRTRAFSTGSNPRPWSEALARLIERARAGPVSPEKLQQHVAGKTGLQPDPLLAAEEITALIDSLDTRTERSLAKRLGKMDAEKIFAEARELWASGHADQLEALIEKNLPDELRPTVARLRELAASRLAAALKEGGSPVVVLDAWLALGPDGILARLRQ